MKNSGKSECNSSENVWLSQHLKIRKWLVPLLLGLWAAIGLAFVFWGIFANDEGWYCLISREVWRGRALYADVRFTQMPLLPHLYGGVLSFLPARIESGRLFSLTLAFMGVVFLWKACRQRYGWHAALAGLLTILLHKSFLTEMTHVRTPALTFALGAVCFYCVVQFHGDRPNRNRWVVGAGLGAGLLVLTRLSLLPLALFLPLYMAIVGLPEERKRLFSLAAFGAWCIPALAGAYFWTVAGERFLFGIYGFHAQLASKENAVWWLFSFLYHSWYETGFWSLLVLGVGGTLWIMQKNRHFHWRRFGVEWLVLVAWLASTLIHLSRQPAFATYQVPLAWAPMVLTAWLVRQILIRQRYESILGTKRRPGFTYGRLLAVFILLCVVGITFQSSYLVASPSLRPEGLVEVLQQAQPRSGEKLITFEAGVAFCAPELEIVPGYEMSEFSLLPVMPAKRQEELRGVSLAKFKRDLQTADILVIRSRDLVRLAVGSSQQIKWVSDLTSGWRRVSSLENYGQFGEAIEVWRHEPRS